MSKEPIDFNEILHDLFILPEEKPSMEKEKLSFRQLLPAVLTLSADVEQRQLEMREAFSKCHTLAIGDLNGRKEALESNLYLAGITDQNGTIQKNEAKKIRFAGDILADRGTDGFYCLHRIQELRACGHDVEVMIGNHDAWMIIYLFLRELEVLHVTLNKMHNPQGKGMIELLEYCEVGKFITEALREHFAKDLLEEYCEEICSTIEKMKPTWYKVLLSMKFFCVDLEDEVLYLHTPPTPEICALVVDMIGDGHYSYSLEDALKRDTLSYYVFTFPVTEHRLDPFCSDSPCHTLSKEDFAYLRRAGITKIVFGHDTHLDAVDVTTHAGCADTAGVRLLNVDGGSYHTPKDVMQRSLLGMSVGKIIAAKKQDELQGIAGVSLILSSTDSKLV